MSQENSKRLCFNCAQPYELLSYHLRECPRKGHECGNCYNIGHLEEAYERFREQRIQAAQIRKTRQKSYQRNSRSSQPRRSKNVAKPVEKHDKQKKSSNFESHPTYMNLAPSPELTYQDLFALHTSKYALFTNLSRLTINDHLAAGVDTCSSCFILTDMGPFQTFDTKRSGTIRLLDKSTTYVGTSIARLSSAPFREEFSFPTYYVPDRSLNILSNKELYIAGIVPRHDSQDPKLVLPDSRSVPMSPQDGISIAKLMPPTKPFNTSA